MPIEKVITKVRLEDQSSDLSWWLSDASGYRRYQSPSERGLKVGVASSRESKEE